MAAGTTRVFVVTPTGSDRVVAYDAWAMGQIALTDAPARLPKGARSEPRPVALLARREVHLAHERKGLRAALRRDVVARAADFSRHLVDELEQSPTDEFHLLLLLKVGSRVIGTRLCGWCAARMTRPWGQAAGVRAARFVPRPDLTVPSTANPSATSHPVAPGLRLGHVGGTDRLGSGSRTATSAWLAHGSARRCALA